MHPFLPALSVIFLLAGDAAMLFLRMNVRQPEVVANLSSLWTTVGMCLLIGSGLAFWLRRFGLLFPSWAAILSLLWVGLLAVV